MHLEAATAAQPTHLCAGAYDVLVPQQLRVHHQQQVAPVALLKLVSNSSTNQRACQQLNHERKVAALVAPANRQAYGHGNTMSVSWLRAGMYEALQRHAATRLALTAAAVARPTP